jgi:hypothetical protein
LVIVPRSHHTEGLKDVSLNVFFKRKSRNRFNQVTRQGHSRMRVGDLFSGQSNPARDVTSKVVSQRNELLRVWYGITEEPVFDPARISQ